MQEEQHWDQVIKSRSSFFSLNVSELWRYRDLLFLFVRRDIVAVYKQTVLGPIWFVLQPILTSLTFNVVFGNIAGLSTDGKPAFLFYLAGTVCWNYFAECLNNTSSTFITNASIFGKVYFPRLISPLSMVMSSFVKFLIQFTLFIGVYAYFSLVNHADIHMQWSVLLIPVLVIIMAFLGLGIGLIISSMTTKYRDLRFLVAFGVQLLMYATPVIYPISSIHGKLLTLVNMNPMTPVIEAFRYSFFGTGMLSFGGLLYSFAFSFVLLIASMAVFNRVEKNFMDTV